VFRNVLDSSGSCDGERRMAVGNVPGNYYQLNRALRFSWFIWSPPMGLSICSVSGANRDTTLLCSRE
jgi:hypothetical protein